MLIRQIRSLQRNILIRQQFINQTAVPVIHGESIRNLVHTKHIKRPPQRCFHVSAAQQKYIKISTRSAEDTDDEDDEAAEFKDERDSKVVKAKVNSLRADLLLKSGLSMARNKVENIFYESKIRVNGKKLQKKSVQLNVGDEIDVIRGFSQTNPSHLVVSRVIILSASERDEGLSVNLRRYKSLLIENYSGQNAYKSSANAEHGT